MTVGTTAAVSRLAYGTFVRPGSEGRGRLNRAQPDVALGAQIASPSHLRLTVADPVAVITFISRQGCAAEVMG